MKVALFAPGQSGDALTVSSVLKYKDELWGSDAQIVWFIADENRDLFKYNPYLEVRHFAHGWEISEHDKATIYTERIAKDKADGKPEWGDWSILKTADNTMDLSKKHLFPVLSDIDLGFFPVPWMVSSNRRFGTTYPNFSKKIFGVPDDYDWHPTLFFSPDERGEAFRFVHNLPYPKTILIESYCGSGQSKITHEMIAKTMLTCQQEWGPCNFIFLSHKYLNTQPEFPESLFKDNVVSAKDFTVRQCALLGNYADLLISTSSGVTCALSAHDISAFPSLQYCGSAVCGTKELANGEMIQVFTDDNPNSEKEYYEQLNYLLQRYK